MKKPDFFILGAGKCGTTSLYTSLRQHSDIFMPGIKEPSYFCDMFQVVKNPIQYFQLFDLVRDEKAIGEASHAYLTNPSSAEMLKLLFPEARLIVILRNPADRAHSLYHHMRREGYEKEATFERALAAEEERVRSRAFKRNCPQYYYNFLYFRSGLYGEQIDRYLSFFARHQFHFLTLNQLRSDPRSALREIFRFLGVNAEVAPALGHRNESVSTARFPSVQYAWRTKVAPLLDIFDMPFVKKVGDGVLRRVNMKEIPPIRRETRESLLKRYADDLGKLYELTHIRFVEPTTSPG